MSKFNPNLILLVYVFNDIDYLGRIIERAAVFRNESLIQRLEPRRVLYMNSYLFQEIYTRWRRIRHSILATERDPYNDPVLLRRHIVDLHRFVSLARELAPDVCIVPYDHQVAENEAAKTRYRKFVGQVAAAGLPVCSLLETFAGLKRADLQVSALDGHPNAEANRLAAISIAACLFGSRETSMAFPPLRRFAVPTWSVAEEKSRAGQMPVQPLSEVADAAR
jgi:hypothetical protein